MKIVINRCFGVYRLSKVAYEELGLQWDDYGFCEDMPRNDPRLVACIEKLGELANGQYADLRIVQIPDGVEWYIVDRDGAECVHEKHRSWP